MPLARFWAGSHISQDIPPEFLSTTHGCQASPFHICSPTTSLDGCRFFNSVAVRLPVNLISDGSELVYILVVILIGLCEEASHVCLCHLLDQKSHTFIFFNALLYKHLHHSWFRGRSDMSRYGVTEGDHLQ